MPGWNFLTYSSQSPTEPDILLHTTHILEPAIHSHEAPARVPCEHLRPVSRRALFWDPRRLAPPDTCSCAVGQSGGSCCTTGSMPVLISRQTVPEDSAPPLPSPFPPLSSHTHANTRSRALFPVQVCLYEVCCYFLRVAPGK